METIDGPAEAGFPNGESNEWKLATVQYARRNRLTERQALRKYNNSHDATARHRHDFSPASKPQRVRLIQYSSLSLRLHVY